MFKIHRFIHFHVIVNRIFCATQVRKRNVARKRVLIGVLATLLWACESNANALSLEQAQRLAVASDPFLTGSALRESAFRHESEGAKSWDNPKIVTSFQNIPVNSLSFNQEPMTQIKLGIQQALPRGNSAQLNSTMLLAEANKQPIARQARRAWLVQQVSLLWLDWYQAHHTIALLQDERQLMSQLLEIAESVYRSGIGNTKQQDIIAIRLEILRLNDALLQQQQAKAEAFAHLSRYFDVPQDNAEMVPRPFNISAMLAKVEHINQLRSIDIVSRHPSVQLVAMDETIAAKKLALAREQSKPKWAFEASYGYRSDAPSGVSQADFISLGVQVDLPLFGTKKQDADISASAARVGATATQRRIEIRRLAALAEEKKAEILYLSTRRSDYASGLLKQAQFLADATLSAYTNDNGNLSDVLRARITQQTMRLESLNLDVSLANALIEMSYLYDPVVKFSLEQASDISLPTLLNEGRVQ